MMFMFLVNQVFMLIIVIGGRNVVDILKTPECVHTWKNDFNRLVKPPTNQRSLYPNCSLGNDVPYVLEDLCHGQRWISMNNYSSHIAAEVTINHEYKFAYISNKKSGCTEIGHFLKKVFKTDFFTGCNESQVHASIWVGALLYVLMNQLLMIISSSQLFGIRMIGSSPP
mgnify:CR=1 FL=1